MHGNTRYHFQRPNPASHRPPSHHFAFQSTRSATMQYISPAPSRGATLSDRLKPAYDGPPGQPPDSTDKSASRAITEPRAARAGQHFLAG